MLRNKKNFSEVAILRCGDGAGELTARLRESVELLGGIMRYVKPTDTVFIKPNLTAGMPSNTGGTTDVYFTEAVIELVKEAGPARIVVGECSGNESRTAENFSALGYVDMCARQGVELLDLDYTEFVEMEVEQPRYKKTIRLPSVFMENSIYISVPVLKTHISAGITVAVKNSFGLIPDVDKLNAHRDNAIEKIIADIASVKPADLIFVDGRLGSEGIAGGSDFDHPRRADLVIAGNDPVAVDTICARVMMQNPRVKHLQWAAEQGAGNDRPEFILTRGLPVEEAQVDFMSPADQIIRESGGKVRICELNACSLCCTAAAGPMGRYSKNPASLLAPVDIVTGPGEWDAPEKPNPRTMLLGDCIQEKYRALGTWIGGCPVNVPEYMKVMAEYDIVCAKCAQAVENVLAAIENGGDRAEPATGAHADVDTGDFAALASVLPDIRVLASNKSVFQGARNNAGMDDHLLAVGKCADGYIRNHSRRVHKVSDIDFAEYAAYRPGCPVTENDVLDGVRELAAKIREKRVKKKEKSKKE